MQRWAVNAFFWYLCHGHEMLPVGYQCFVANSNNTYLFQMHVWFFIHKFLGTIMEERITPGLGALRVQSEFLLYG